METINGVKVWGDPDPKSVEQIARISEDAKYCALMADHHFGYSMPVGGVAAYPEHVSPSGVGFDIACGNKAVQLDIPPNDVQRSIGPIMDDIFSRIQFGMGRTNPDAPDHELFNDDDPGWATDAAKPLKELARTQLGTVGAGNHYVDVLRDTGNSTWIGVHFGSRGFGHKITEWFMDAAGVKDEQECILFQQDSDLGRQYIAAMQLAGRYAYAGRDWVCQRVADIIGANIISEVHSNHNYAWRETHFGEEMWVIRKGATPAFPGQRGFVGGSMGDISVILQGREDGDGADSLYSTVHGAGRVMARMVAKGKSKRNKETGVVRVIREPAVTQEMMDEWINNMGVELRGADVDESPHCYKRLPEVLAAHESSIMIVESFRPMGVTMAPPDNRR